MNPKFPPGTLVQIVKHSIRHDLVGEKFFVDEFGMTRLLNRLTGNEIPATMCYRSPFKSKARTDKDIWIPEDHLREVDPDEGFEFEEDWHVWYPTNTKVPDYGYANA